ncbi:MAG: Gfo/Idh/MocA family oxidoreductase [Gemmatimonadaceae bacterium]
MSITETGSRVSESLRVALVGCGRISKNHFEAISRVHGLELAGVADIVTSRARAASDEYGVPAFESLETMLAHVECDIVTVATPSGLHPVHGMAAARAGKHVVSEKPMAISLEGADSLIATCAENNVKLFVVKQNRLNPAIQLVKRAVDKGRLGRIHSANCTVRWARPQDYYDQAPWRGTWAMDGGAFMNQASHYVDLIQWLAGPVDSVVAITATQERRIEAEDSGAAVLQFRNGGIGVLDVTMLTYPKNLEGSLTILGDRGSVKIGGTAVNRVETWLFEDYDNDDKLIDAAATAPPSVYGFGHEGYYRNVVQVLGGRGIPDTDGAEGRKSLEIILAIYQSARTGRLVVLG